MPVIRIFYDETLDPVMRAGRGEIQNKLEARGVSPLHTVQEPNITRGFVI